MYKYDKEKWVELFQSALVELEHAAISVRIETLANLPGLHSDERQGIEEALRTLRFLEQEEACYQSEKRRLLEDVLSKLHAIEPKIKQL